MRILQLKAARGWSTRQAAASFVLNEQTISSWLRRVDEEGERSLLRLAEPVNKYTDFIRYIICQIKLFFPSMGKERIARVLARAGLHLGVTTAGRFIKEKPSKDLAECKGEKAPPPKTRPMTASPTAIPKPLRLRVIIDVLFLSVRKP